MTGSPRLLVVRLSSLGDVVMATSVPSSIRRALPGAHVTFLTRARYRALLAHHPAVDRLIEAPDDLSSPLGWFRLGLGLREARFDAVVDLQYNWRTLALEAALAPVKVRRWDRSNLARRRKIRDHSAPAVPHMVERFHRAAEPWTRGGILAPVIGVDPEAAVMAGEFLESRGEPGTTWLGVVPVARWATKRWAPERFARVCLAWTGAGKGRRAVVFFGPGDGAVREAFLRAGGGGPRTHRAEGSLSVVSEILRRMSAVVAGDTGLMHLSAAVGTPTLGLYGPTSPDFGVSPYGEGNAAMGLELDCRPCSLHGGHTCPLGHHRCMSELQPERVLAGLQTIFHAP